jgi:predicted metal-binding membrane protein
VTDASPIERALRRDRLIVLGGLLAIVGLAWVFVLEGAGTGMSVRAMTTWRFPPPAIPPDNAAWPARYWFIMLLMWWVMMIAMMTPSAAPMVLLYARVARHARQQQQTPPAVVATAWFVLGYLMSWLAFSAAAVSAQWALERLGLLHMMMMWSLDKWLSATLLIAAGIYQLSPLKNICLGACRSPAQFLSRHWREGQAGAVRLGMIHGLYCVGCCWLLMALLFAGGVMNVLWIAGLAVLVLIEKVAPYGRQVAGVAGAAAIAAGIAVIAAT